MPKRHGFVISAVGLAKCVGCQREKETYYLTSTDGTFEGAICHTDLRKLLRIHLGTPPAADTGVPPVTNGQQTEDLEHARS